MDAIKIKAVLPSNPMDGRTRIELNGVDVAHAFKRIEITAGADEVTTVRAEFYADVNIEGEAHGAVDR